MFELSTLLLSSMSSGVQEYGYNSLYVRVGVLQL